MVETSSNQDEMMQNLLAINPRAKDICNTLQAANGNGEDVFINAAKQKGCSEQQAKDILAQLRQMWSSL